MKKYETLTDALDDLKKKGYEADFATQTVCLYCGDLDIRLDPDDFHIDEVYQFEQESKPHDNSILYAITSATGVRGTLVDSYDPSPGTISMELEQKLKARIRIQ